MVHKQASRRKFMGSVAALAGIVAITSSIEIVEAQGRKILRARARRDIEILDPAYMTGSVDIELQYATMPRLAHVVKEGDGFTWKPTEYVAALNQTDTTHFAFTLKSGFMWTNGYGELTADDVKYSFERMLESDFKDDWIALDHVEVTGTYSGTIVLKHPSPAFGVGTLASGVGCLVCKKATEAAGGQYTTEIPATCGPYVVKEWTPKQRIVFTRNPEWPGEKPEFDEIQFHVITDLPPAELAFEARELDITQISPKAMLRYKENPPAESQITVAGHLNFGWLGMNTEHPKLADIRIRKAIQSALDVDSALTAAFFGAAKNSHGVVPPGVLGNRSKSGYSYDPDRARALLKDAAVSSLTLELKTANLQERLIMAQAFQANLNEVGIQVNVTSLDVGPFWNVGREKKGDDWRDLQIYITRFGTGLNPADALKWFVKDQVGNWNWERWSDPEFDTLFQNAAIELDPAKRAKMYLRMQEIMEETAAYVWLQHEPEVFIHRSRIVPTIEPTGDQDFRRFRSV